MAEYRVNLDIYNGPLDLLLYLIRRDEVDIYDIPIAYITEQYVQYVDMLHQLDPNLAGEFLVMAATLMEVKSAVLLPGPEDEMGEDEDLQIDPRADLVRQLLQYKAFKDAAVDLQRSAEMQSLRFPRKPATPDFGEGKEHDLEDVQIWDLFDAFRDVMSAIGASKKNHEVIYDDTPLQLHQADLLDRLQREGRLTFKQVFEGRTRRSEVIGLFLAMLELCRLRQCVTKQGEIFGEIIIEYLDPATVDQRPENMVTVDGKIGTSDDSESVWNPDDPELEEEFSESADWEDDEDDEDKFDDGLEDIRVDFDMEAIEKGEDDDADEEPRETSADTAENT